jgi:hypothetical protein
MHCALLKLSPCLNGEDIVMVLGGVRLPTTMLKLYTHMTTTTELYKGYTIEFFLTEDNIPSAIVKHADGTPVHYESLWRGSDWEEQHNNIDAVKRMCRHHIDGICLKSHNREKEYEHRLKCISTDVERLMEFIHESGLNESFLRSSKHADYGWTYIFNIETACELDNSESLNWKA